MTVDIINILFEALMICLASICFIDIKFTSENVVQDIISFFMGIVYGIVLEVMTISAFHFYSYGNFLLMFYDVPLSIGIGWGVIIYAARSITSKLKANLFQTAIISGLLALNIDLSMDIIAVKLHFWNWGFGPSYEYFFIPFGNFYAWFNVVSSFVFFLSFFKSYNDPLVNKLSGIISFVCSLIWVLATNLFYVYIIPSSFWTHFIVTWGLIGSALIYSIFIILKNNIIIFQSYSWTAKSVYIGFHGFFILMGLVEGILSNLIFLSIALSMVIIIEIFLEGDLVKERLPSKYIKRLLFSC